MKFYLQDITSQFLEICLKCDAASKQARLFVPSTRANTLAYFAATSAMKKKVVQR
jgi:hypothetical protein